MRLLYVFFTLMTFGLNAQDFSQPSSGPDSNPEKIVELHTTLIERNDSLMLELVLEVDSNWIVYDSIVGDDGPVPLSIQLDELTNVQLLKVLKPKVKKKHDDVFECDIYYFSGKVTYVLLVQQLKKGAPLTIRGGVELMACNLSSGVCLPPSFKSFRVQKK